MLQLSELYIGMKAFALGASRFGFRCFFMPVVILDYGAIDCVEPFEVGGFFPIKDALSIWTN